MHSHSHSSVNKCLKMPTSALSEDSTGVQRTRNENSCDSSEATHLLFGAINARGVLRTLTTAFGAADDDDDDDYLSPSPGLIRA